MDITLGFGPSIAGSNPAGSTKNSYKMNKLHQIKNEIKEKCEKRGVKWFYFSHLLAVEKNAELLLKYFPKADKKVVKLGVWLHDLQHVLMLKGDHEIIGAREARKVLIEYGYEDNIIEEVAEIISTHACKKRMPGSIEGKILASADAMSHFYNDFYLLIAALGKDVGIKKYKDLDNFKKWSLEKLETDYRKKIFFPFARKQVSGRYKLLKRFFSEKG